MDTIALTRTYTYTDDVTRVLAPEGHPNHAVIAIHNPIGAPDGDGAVPTAYWEGGNRHHGAPIHATNGLPIPHDVLDTAQHTIERYGLHTTADLLPRILHVHHGLIARTEIVSLSRSSWGMALHVATNEFHAATGAPVVPAEDLGNPEFIAWLRGHTYRMAVVERDAVTGQWSPAPDRTCFASVVYADPTDGDPHGEFAEAAAEFWSAWSDEHLAVGARA